MSKGFKMCVLMLFLVLALAPRVEANLGGVSSENLTSLTMDLGIVSKYIGEVNGMTLSNDPCLQSGIKLGYNEWYLKGWVSVKEGGFFTEQGNEWDGILGWNKKWQGIIFDSSLNYYDVYKDGDLYALKLSFVYPNRFITPYGTVTKEWAVHSGYKGGFFYRTGARYDFQISGMPIALDCSLAGHTDSYGYKAEPISSGQVAVSTNYHLSNFLIVPEFRMQYGFNDDDDGIPEKGLLCWGGVNIGYSHKWRVISRH